MRQRIIVHVHFYLRQRGISPSRKNGSLAERVMRGHGSTIFSAVCRYLVPTFDIIESYGEKLADEK